MMSSRLVLGVLLAALGCASANEDAGRDTLAAVDTLKQATDTLPTQDSATAQTTQPGARPAVSDAKTSTPSKTTGASTMTKTKRDSIIGHDVVTPLDPKKRQLDTVKKRPPR